MFSPWLLHLDTGGRFKFDEKFRLSMFSSSTNNCRTDDDDDVNKKSSHTGSRYLLNLSVVVSDTKTLFKRHSGLKIIPSTILHGSRISLKRFRKRGRVKERMKKYLE